MDMLSEMSKDQLLKIISEALITSKYSNENNKRNNTIKEIINYSSNEASSILKIDNEPVNGPVNEIKIFESNKNTEKCNIDTENNIILEDQSINFNIPIENIVSNLNEIQNLVLILGNKDKKFKNWYDSLNSLLNNFKSELISDKEKINNDFIKSLETITKIFSITSKFSPIEKINESVLTPTIRKMIIDYNSNNFQNLDYYCNENLSMFTLNNDIDENLIKLIPVLSNQLLNFNKQLKKFYNLYELVDDYEFNDNSFLNNLPTKNDINLFNEINKATDIKILLQTNFNKINPILIDQLNIEIKNLNDYINSKLYDLKILINKVIDLNHQLFKNNENDYLNLPNFINDNNLLLSKIGIKSSIFNNYNLIYNNLIEIKLKRENLLNNYLIKVENLWSILRSNSNSNSNEIQNFLKLNKNLFTDSLLNFKNLLNQLEIEKLNNIKKFIKISREKIKSFWDILMYDENSRLKFNDFYINDENLFNENLLNSHSLELERLRNETESIKPLLNLISKLNLLIDEKKQLDQSSKDPKRLLQRNSFKILKEEERTRNKLQKQLPSIINELKLNITQFENENQRKFQLNNEPYIEKLIEIEELLLHKKRNNRSNFNSPNFNLISGSTKKKLINKSNNSSNIKSKNLTTPSNSIIRRRDLSQMTNPFLSSDPTPLKSQKISTLTPTSSKILSTPQSAFIGSNNIKAKSPIKTLNYNASTKIIKSLQSPNVQHQFTTKQRTITTNRSPMGILSSSKLNRYNNNNNINLDNNNGNEYKSFIKTNKSMPSSSSIPVEELSDSMLDYSNDENDNNNNNNNQINGNELQIGKENLISTSSAILRPNTALTSLKISKTPSPTIRSTQQFNLSLDSETF
jgi:hypothetical protein